MNDFLPSNLELARQMNDAPTQEAYFQLYNSNVKRIDQSLIMTFDNYIQEAGDLGDESSIRHWKDIKRITQDLWYKSLLEKLLALPTARAKFFMKENAHLFFDSTAFRAVQIAGSLKTTSYSDIKRLNELFKYVINALITALAEEKSDIRFLELVKMNFAFLEKTEAFDALMANLVDGKIDSIRYDLLSMFMSKAARLGGGSALNDLYSGTMEKVMADLGNRAKVDQAINTLEYIARLTEKANPFMWAGTQVYLGKAHLYAHQSAGDEYEQKSEKYFESSFSGFTPDEDPDRWSMTCDKIGEAYYGCINGDRQNNLQRSIMFFKKAFDAARQSMTGSRWAYFNLRVGGAYYKLTIGDREENLLQSVHYYNQAGSVLTKKDDLKGWKSVQYNLGLAYQALSEEINTTYSSKSIEGFNNWLSTDPGDNHPVEVADVHTRLGKIFSENILRHGEAYLNKTLASFEKALKYFDRAGDVDNCANIHCLMAKASFSAFITGSEEQIENIILHGEKALSYYEDEDPGIASYCHRLLGIAYSQKPGAAKSENLEISILHYEAALLDETIADSRFIFETLSLDLVRALCERQKGNKTENLEKALQVLLGLLKSNEKSRLELYPLVLMETGVAYCDRMIGDSAENQETSLQYFRDALANCDNEGADEYLWGDIMFNMGATYCDRKRGDKSENIEKGIECFENSLKVRTKERDEDKWSNSQINLGYAYHMRMAGDRHENLRKSIACFEQALTVRHRAKSPVEWAAVHIGLGNSYCDRGALATEADLEKGIGHYNLALQIYRQEQNPYTWGQVQMNLGTAYTDRKKGDKKDNLNKALACFINAQKVYSLELYPEPCRSNSIKLGSAYYELMQYGGSREAFETAHRANELLRAQSVKPEVRKQLAVGNSYMYKKLVHVCLLENDVRSAFFYATAAKSRSLLDLIHKQVESMDVLLATDPKLFTAWEEISAQRKKVDRLMMLLERQRQNTEEIIEEVTVQRRTLLNLLDEAFFHFPKLSATEAAPLLDVDEMQSLIGELKLACCVEYYQHQSGWCAFIVTSKNIRCVHLNQVSDRNLDVFLNWLKEFEKGTEIATDEKIRYNVLSLLFSLFVQPLDLTAIAQDLPVVIAPFGNMHLLPLHIAYNPSRQSFWIETNVISYASSISAFLIQAKLFNQTGVEKSPAKLLSVAFAGNDPDNILEFAEREGTVIADIFHNGQESVKLHGKDAQPLAVIEACSGGDFEVIHFSCHANYNDADPAGSGLMLSKGWLTAERIQSELRLKNHPLVVLGACRTGQYNLDAGDEAIGLMASFLAGGSGAVISSLWEVDDESTLDLFSEFYKYREKNECSDAKALRHSMLHLRSKNEWRDPYFWGPFRVMGISQ